MMRVPSLMRIARAAEELVGLEELQWRRDQRRGRRRMDNAPGVSQRKHYVRHTRGLDCQCEAYVERKLDLQHEESQGMLEDD